MKAFNGPRKQRGFIGLFGAAAPYVGQALGGLGGLFGASAASGHLKQGRNDLMNLPGMSGPANIFGNFGSSQDGRFQMDAGLQGLQNQLGSTGQNLLGGGLFNNPDLQMALGQNNILGALGQSQNALSQQMGGSAFGGLGGLFNQAQGLSSQFGNALQGTGFADTQASELANLRAAAQPAQDRLTNRLQDQLFAKGMLGTNTTATGEAFRGLGEAFGQQDLNFQTQAFDRALQQRNQQIGAAQGFGQQAAGFEGQGFGQLLQALQQNQQAGTSQFQQAMGLLGGAGDLFGQQYGLGLQGAGGALDFGSFGLDAASMPYQLQAQLLQGSGEHASGLANMATEQAGASGGLFSGIGNALGGIFSDRRLKDNVKKVGKLNDFNLYIWEWNDEAKRIGADQIVPIGVIAQEVEEFVPTAVKTDPDTGFKMVDYEVLAHG